MEKLLTAQEATRKEKRERREQPDSEAPVNGGTPGEGAETVKDRVRYIQRGAIRKKRRLVTTERLFEAKSTALG